MPSPILAAEEFFRRYDEPLRAGVTLVVVLGLVWLVHRRIGRSAARVAVRVAGGELSSEALTRLRFLRRAVTATLVTVGLVIALSNFTEVGGVARTLLASSAIAAAVVGFAARQTLANAIAGLLLAVTQPLRIGDVVTFEGETGTVEDVGLTYTWLRTPAGARIIVPNEKLASGILRNDSIVDPVVAVEASVWLPPDGDAVGALDALRAALPDVTSVVAETSAEGVRLGLTGPPSAPGDRARRESALRESALRALREAAVSS